MVVNSKGYNNTSKLLSSDETKPFKMEWKD